MFWSKRSSHVPEEDLSALLDGELATARRDAVAAHIDNCAACSAALEQLSQVRLVLQRLPRERAPRAFTLTPAMVGIGSRSPAATRQRRSAFVFAPAVALTLFLALLTVDLSSSSSSEDFAASRVGQVEVAKNESGGAAADAATERTASTLALPEGTPAPAAAGAAAPSVAPSASTNQSAPSLQTTVRPPPNPGGATASTTSDDEARDGNFAIDSFGSADGDGTDWLFIGQVLTAIAFVASAAIVFGPRLLKRGS